jgi:hypothetical protein
MSYSRYTTTPETEYDGAHTYGKWKSYNFLTESLAENQTRTLYITNAYEGRPDLISQQIYNTTKLDWVLIAFNKVRNPLNWPRAGDIIRYPLESVVMTEILQ